MHADDVAAYIGPFWRLREAMAYYEWERQEHERHHARMKAIADKAAENGGT